MNVQQKIEKWCRNERFVHYANERISEELVYAPNHRIDPEYEELDEAITWDNRHACGRLPTGVEFGADAMCPLDGFIDNAIVRVIQ